ncbi:unnamed protein product, partial [Bubo scandiacus]
PSTGGPARQWGGPCAAGPGHSAPRAAILPGATQLPPGTLARLRRSGSCSPRPSGGGAAACGAPGGSRTSKRPFGGAAAPTSLPPSAPPLGRPFSPALLWRGPGPAASRPALFLRGGPRPAKSRGGKPAVVPRGPRGSCRARGGAAGPGPR